MQIPNWQIIKQYGLKLELKATNRIKIVNKQKKMSNTISNIATWWLWWNSIETDAVFCVRIEHENNEMDKFTKDEK